MIKNDKQLKITKKRLSDFEEALTKIEAKNDINAHRKEMQLSAIKNDIRKFEKEINEYENLKNGTINCLHIVSFGHFYEALIKGRIAKGWTQADLAEKVALKEQQIQRYEASNYTTASMSRIDEIAYALGLNSHLYITGLVENKFNLPEEYSEEYISKAQKRINTKRTLLN